ncbi:MAG: hypothetical protein R3F42_05205 [Pseudomonadota bacterium]
MMTESGRPAASGTTMPADDTRETARVLEIAAVQIETTLRESDMAIEEMIGAITAMVAGIKGMTQQLDQDEHRGVTCPAGPYLREACQQAEQNMQKAVVAFQFYDRLTQRISHVRENLESLVKVIRSPSPEHPKLWEQLQQRARSVYSLEQERQMYNALISGLSAADVIETDTGGGQDIKSDIELF